MRRWRRKVIGAQLLILVDAHQAFEDVALDELADKQVVELDNERKASMVSNLLVVLCGESEVTPVVNTGTLYQ